MTISAQKIDATGTLQGPNGQLLGTYYLESTGDLVLNLEDPDFIKLTEAAPREVIWSLGRDIYNSIPKRS